MQTLRNPPLCSSTVESIHKDSKEGTVSANYLDKMQENEGFFESIHKDPRKGRVSANYICIKMHEKEGSIENTVYTNVK
jgi:hypothetical protein